MKIRGKLDPHPVWDNRFKGWAAKFIWKNKWRCEDYLEFDDLMNDAYLIFRHIKASYPLVSEPSHIMALFKVAMQNEFNDKAKYKQRKQAAEISLETVLSSNKKGGAQDDFKLIDSLGENNNEGYLRIIISELPPEVRTVLEAFNDEEKLALLRQPRVQSRLAKLLGLPLRRETLNDTLCRIIRLPKNIDLVGILTAALKS